jgi:hypothetical protein
LNASGSTSTSQAPSYVKHLTASSRFDFSILATHWSCVCAARERRPLGAGDREEHRARRALSMTAQQTTGSDNFICISTQPSIPLKGLLDQSAF